MTDNNEADDGEATQREVNAAMQEALGDFEGNVTEMNEKAAENFENDDTTVLAYGVVGVAFDPDRGLKTFGGRLLNHEFVAPDPYPNAGIWLTVVEAWNEQMIEHAIDVGLEDLLGGADDPLEALIENAQVAAVPRDFMDEVTPDDPDRLGMGFQ